jgi:uncharacterized membrane protein
MKETLAVLIALAASFCVNYSTYLQKKAVDTLPGLKLRLTWTVVKTFVTNRPWIIAMVMDAAGTILFMVALIFAPVSVVEPIITAGIALLAYLAIKNLGEKPSRTDYFAISATVLGVICMGISLAEGLPEDKTYNALELWAGSAALVALAVLVPLILHLSRKGNLAAALGISGGIFIGLAGVFSRLLMGDFANLWYVWLPVCALLYPTGFAVFQAGLQRGKAVVVAPIYNGLTVCVPIVMGTIALNEGIPANPALIALRIASFILIVGGTVFLSRRTPEALSVPAPVRTGTLAAERDEPV